MTTLVDNVASDANGTLALFGSSLAKAGAGTYTLTASTPTALATQLAELAFTPSSTDASTTSFAVTVTDSNDQSASGETTLDYTQGSGTVDTGHIFYWLSPADFSVSTPSSYIVNDSSHRMRQTLATSSISPPARRRPTRSAAKGWRAAWSIGATQSL